MNDNFLRSAENLNRERKKRSLRKRLITVLACLVVFCTTYALILPAITMESERRLICSEEALSGHIHTPDCLNDEGDAICGYADFVIHTHDENCLDRDGDLICPLEEIAGHQHDEYLCYAYAQDTEPHEHDENCYDGEGDLVCGLEEELQPLHGELCISGTGELEKTPATTNAEPTLICGHPELVFHQHGDVCFDEEGKLICGATQLLRHQHTEECFETAAPDEGISPEEDAGRPRVMTFEGEDYSVTVSFTPEAGLPGGVSLEVREILPESPDYALYYEQTESLLPEEQGLVFCRFFDVSFVLDGTEVEPSAGVDVLISYRDPVPQDETVVCSAVHFAEDGAEVLPAELQTDEAGNDAVAFTQESFSVVGTAVSALNIRNGSYIFYKDGYAIGSYGSVISPVEIIIDENGYVYPADPSVSISNITWSYQSNCLRNSATGRYMQLGNSVGTSTSSTYMDARIINNAVRFSRSVSGYYGTTIYYLGFDSDYLEYQTGTLFADGDYFLAAKIAEVSDIVIEPGDLEIGDEIKTTGCLVPRLDNELAGEHELKYVWYRSSDNGQSWTQVVRTRVTGDSYNVAEDGSWLNAALDRGADKLYKVVLAGIDGSQPPEQIESREYRIPYFDSIQNGDFEEPAIQYTSGMDPEHYQPFLPNGTAGMVWKTTAGDGEIEYISVVSDSFRNMSYMWHNCESAAKGVQYVELNANMPGALYQDVLTVPGSTMYWSLAHRGRGTTSMRDGSDLARDTMYVVNMSSVLAEQYDVTTQSAVNDVISNPAKYPGAQVVSITDDNRQWYYSTGSYQVPDEQYLTRYFFVAGETAFDRYSPGSGLATTIGNHLDDVHFSMELPPPEEGKVNLQIEKTIEGLDADTARALLEQLRFTVDGSEVAGSQFQNFTANSETSFTASYQIQLDIGYASSVTKNIEELLSGAELDGFERTQTTVAVNGGAALSGSSASVTIWNRDTGVVSFVNTYSAQTVSIELNKTDKNGLPLAGAIFSLEAFDGGVWTLVSERLVSDAQGKAAVGGLERGTLYRLTETAAPDGYHMLTEPVYFRMILSDGALSLVPCGEDGTAVPDWPQQVSPLPGDTPGLRITNSRGLILPETGSFGTDRILLAGACLIFASTVFYGLCRSKRHEGRFRL